MSAYTLHVGDCREVMAGMDAESVDAVVTDPPYGLSFMGRDWDHGVPGEPFWREALRVAKPGAHVLAFGGTRTFHRLAVAIEDAGWEIRDTVMWVYGSGFNKGVRWAAELSGKRTSKWVNVENDAMVEAGWEGWYRGGLKPAWEPIILARKPFKGSVAANVLAHGTGALNVDGCRVECEGKPVFTNGVERNRNRSSYDTGGSNRTGETSTQGRFPANLIHDGSDEVTRLFPNTGPARTGKKQRAFKGWKSVGEIGDVNVQHHADSGSAARFFYCPKSSKRDRDEGLDKVVLIDIESLTCEENTTSSEKLARLLVATEPLPPRVTAEYGTGNKSVTEWSITLFGKALTEQCPTANKSTTSTGISSTIESRILNSLTRYITSASIPGVSLETENGGSRAASAENSNTLTITISEKMALALGVKSAKNGTRLRISASEGRNVHSTVKPTSLMAYLVRLVTPPGGVILDPFMGSGSTGKAAIREGFHFIGIDLSAEYVAIARARIEYEANLHHQGELI